jgi:hypothetical protein
MPRCADERCGRWRPDLSSVERFAGASVLRMGALRFNGLWYCSRACVEQAARAGLNQDRTPARVSNGLPPLRVGVLLRHAGAVTQEQLETALEATKETGLRIGAQLERLGYSTSDDVLRALAAQAGVSYLSTFDITRVERAPVSMPASMVRALGLVPFEADDVLRKLSVVCAAPVPKAAIRALIRLTGWSPEIYLVTDRVFQEALDAYKPAQKDAKLHQAVTVENMSAAAALIAEVAASERAVTMRHADCDSYRWVRVQAPQRVSDLLVTATQEERGCQAELIAH